MARHEPSDLQLFIERYGPRTLAYVVGLGLLVILTITAAGTCATIVNNTEAAVVVNNVSGGVSTYENGGMVLHLPFGLSSVYKVDKSQRLLRLTKEHRNPEHPMGDPVNIKTNDGSNVEMDVEVLYQLQSSRAFEAIRELGDDKNIEDILRALTRSEIRSEFGELSTLEIAEAGPRSAKLNRTQQNLSKRVQDMGIQIVSMTPKNFSFDPEYDKIIRERKEADQILTNQKDYQDATREEGKRLIAEATRDKESAIARLQGEIAKELLTAEGNAKRILTKAEQTAYQSEREGEIALQTAEQEAAAVLAEGKQKAEALQKLFDAYESGGEGLVKEQLIKLYEGVIIRARPYAPSDRIEQYNANPLLRNPAPAGK